ncbi:MAG: hypothetical protein AAGK04_09505, partial [Planctomycetota bacterium]
IAMGAFRGLFVNILWIRANQLKEDGRYYEAMELSNAITKLTPRFPRVWAFHAWNMAYNISVTTQTADERWQWVRNGINLLRNEAVVHNPNDVLVHRELAWIFLHKVGGWADDANRHYKQQLAMEWEIVLGTPPRPSPEIRTPELATQAYIDWFRPVAEAADTMGGVDARAPNAPELRERLLDVGLEANRDLLLRIALAEHAKTSPQARGVVEQFGDRAQAFQALYEDPEYADAWGEIVPHIRRRMLIDQYNMAPGRMLHYFSKYGPLDYRHSAAHAVYWASTGVEQVLGRLEERNRKDADVVNADRVVIQAIQDLYRSGTVYLNFIAGLNNDPNALLATGNVFFADAYGRTVDEIIERSRYDRIAGTTAEGRGQVWSFYIHGYENFLKDVTRHFYRRGQLDLANRYYTILRTHDRMNLNDPLRAQLYSKPLEEFVADQFLEFRAYSPHVAAIEVLAALEGAYLALGNSDSELFREQFEYARDFHRYFMEKQRAEVIVDPVTGPKAVMNPDFRIHAGLVFGSVVASVGVEQASAMYANAPDDLKRFAYDDLFAMFGGRVEQIEMRSASGETLDFNTLFPEPPGMAGFRRWAAEQSAERQRNQLQLERR